MTSDTDTTTKSVVELATGTRNAATSPSITKCFDFLQTAFFSHDTILQNLQPRIASRTTRSFCSSRTQSASKKRPRGIEILLQRRNNNEQLKESGALARRRQIGKSSSPTGVIQMTSLQKIRSHLQQCVALRSETVRPSFLSHPSKPPDPLTCDAFHRTTLPTSTGSLPSAHLSHTEQQEWEAFCAKMVEMLIAGTHAANRLTLSSSLKFVVRSNIQA